MPASIVRERLGPTIWQGYYKFAFERNPWDRQVSFYYFMYPLGRTPRPTFEEHFTRRGSRLRNSSIYMMNGQLAVDFLGRYETLERDLAVITHTIGMTGMGALPRAKGHYRPSGHDYRSMYTHRTRTIVEDWYSEEIRLLHYRF
jgi:hypothetical protein